MSETKEIAKQVLSDYDAEGIEKIERDSDGAVIFDPSIVKGFPLYPVSGRFGTDYYHTNPWLNGNRKYLRNLNSQESNTSRILYAFDNAKGILEDLRRYSQGESFFTVDTPDNGFLTVFRDNYELIENTLNRVNEGAKRQAKSGISKLSGLDDAVRRGFYWTNIPKEVQEAGKAFSEVIQDFISARKSDFRFTLNDYLTQNPQAFRAYFGGLVDFVKGNSALFNQMKIQTAAHPTLASVQDEQQLTYGDYIQGKFFVPGEGWKMLDVGFHKQRSSSLCN
ncbi:MAG: hypothetical protein ACTSX6_11165 [Candidatus Heimdallarchaeaceae archaeon]